ncbi:hypothetical protein BpHYR1_038188 [Brachionus plicatilis]|uniref:Uncharacterized protein n=1 Tax=Brachionus plicatilis TaxID=10195 RepID=A0A3M7S5X1_BRAPC|nr:hypothetical protein BpHYR1_038188 [Brachionus plicatilis]
MNLFYAKNILNQKTISILCFTTLKINLDELTKQQCSNYCDNYCDNMLNLSLPTFESYLKEITTVWRIEIDKNEWFKSQKRKRVQSSKTGPALQRQSSENFAVNQNTIVQNSKPAILELFSQS